MPAKDIYHDTVKLALEKDQWLVTHDSYTLHYGRKDYYIDLGAESLLTAEQGTRRIAVEVKSFVGISETEDFRNSLGQFIFYQVLLRRQEPERTLYLALPEEAYLSLNEEGILEPFLQDVEFRLIVFRPASQEIVKWIEPASTEIL